MDLQRSIEKPARYRLIVKWETLEEPQPSASAARRISRPGARWSGIASPRRPRSSTRGRPSRDF